MSKKEKPPADYVGVDEKASKSGLLLALMVKENITKFTVNYSGSGDSGDIENAFVVEPEETEASQELSDVAIDILDEIVSPDFNNSGSHGDATFEIIDHVLNFKCDHHDVIETSEDISFDQDLISKDDFA